MIIDNIEMIKLYPQISDEIKNFISGLNKDLQIGKYKINDYSYANIEEYFPKPYEQCKFEAHKKYIDIQIVLSGRERLDYTEVKSLKIIENYDKKRDIMFFETSQRIYGSVILEPFKFAMIYPHEAHKPQIALDNSQKVKKAVIKILTNKLPL